MITIIVGRSRRSVYVTRISAGAVYGYAPGGPERECAEVDPRTVEVGRWHSIDVHGRGSPVIPPHGDTQDGSAVAAQDP
jgi:hypothetical protein